uniref:Retrotrans_gag domain-containing protein n=1 Tax=Mesocestoides corti TaxID=53468 RepID=A0A5K3FUU8_MESCO
MPHIHYGKHAADLPLKFHSRRQASGETLAEYFREFYRLAHLSILPDDAKASLLECLTQVIQNRLLLQQINGRIHHTLDVLIAIVHERVEAQQHTGTAIQARPFHTLRYRASPNTKASWYQ